MEESSETTSSVTIETHKKKHTQHKPVNAISTRPALSNSLWPCAVWCGWLYGCGRGILTGIYLLLAFGERLFDNDEIINQISQIFHVLSIFVNLFLIRDLFSSRELPNLISNQFINTTFYISSGFVFLVLIAFNFGDYNPQIILGIFLLIWTNDSFAYLIGKNFGKQKLFASISPKKTVEGFLGGVFFAAIGSYFIALIAPSLSFTNWLILSVLVSVFGTLGDLVESKYRQTGICQRQW